MKRFSLLLFACVSFFISFAQNDIEVYPNHWWVGMKWNKVQLMVHGHNAGKMDYHTVYPGVKILRINTVENPDYAFIDLFISPIAKVGTVGIKTIAKYAEDVKTKPILFELKPRRKGNGTEYAQGVRSQDFIYLIMPDRFANGDYSNDHIPGMRDQALNRDSIEERHGGDLKGVIDHLDYLKDLGITSVWLTPVLENDMKRRTEHGYAITNHYKVDPRLGTNETYKQLSNELHKRGMKLIQDAVYNHCGLYHPFIEDLPARDWIHQWPTFTNPNYKDQTLFDPYVAKVDRELQSNGWFDRIMPDLNQKSPYVANYLIQHAIWCVEEFGIDAWRIDTYIYCDLDFMNRCNQALLDEYPRITMFGECWVGSTVNQAYFARNNMNTSFKSNLIGVKDFQWLFDGVYNAVKNGNNERIYQVLSNDFLYKDPMYNVIFLDNHDITRFYSEVGEDAEKLKMGIGLLLTQRGIPQLYYGTEVLITGVKNPDVWVRKDFPGGWKEDPKNKFTTGGRNVQENEVFNWTKTIANYRKNSSALKTGKLMQYVPQNGTYTYFRYDDKETVMVIMNTSIDEKTVDIKKFIERTNGFAKAKNIITSSVMRLNESWKVPGKTIWIMELVK
jgi:glycosidase